MNDIDTGIQGKFTFSNFITAESNIAAFTEAASIATSYPDRCQWLWVEAGCGQGGSHLLHAMGNVLLTKIPKLKIKRICAHSLITKLKHANNTQDLHEVLTEFGNLDCLFIDTMSYLGLNQQQEATFEQLFYNTLILLMNKGSFVCFSSNQNQSKFTSNKLKLLFKHCKKVIISAPEPELKLNVAKEYLLEYGLELPKDDLLIFKIKSAVNIRAARNYAYKFALLKTV